MQVATSDTLLSGRRCMRGLEG